MSLPGERSQANQALQDHKRERREQESGERSLGPVRAPPGLNPNQLVADHGGTPSGYDPTLAARRSALTRGPPTRALSPMGLLRKKLLNRALGCAPAIVVHMCCIGTLPRAL